ncbi:MAG: energy-coupling factor transporter transmembrane component T [Nitrospirota bacterium]
MTFILAYVILAISLFAVKGICYHVIAGLSVSFFLLFIPFKKTKSGIFPITIFLVFTFAGNLFFHPGRIIYDLGFLAVTDEGLLLSGVRTLRVFTMIFGAKILTHLIPIDELIHAMNRLLSPLERTGLPVNDFFHIMRLTMKAFPVLIAHLTGIYKEGMKRKDTGGFMGRIRHMAVFLMPVFVQSITSPESFFVEGDNGKGY